MYIGHFFLQISWPQNRNATENRTKDKNAILHWRTDAHTGQKLVEFYKIMAQNGYALVSLEACNEFCDDGQKLTNKKAVLSKGTTARRGAGALVQ